jgi:hypothetical protein
LGSEQGKRRKSGLLAGEKEREKWTVGRREGEGKVDCWQERRREKSGLLAGEKETEKFEQLG